MCGNFYFIHKRSLHPPASQKPNAGGVYGDNHWTRRRIKLLSGFLGEWRASLAAAAGPDRTGQDMRGEESG